MTKTLKKSLLITFITLFGAVAALFAVSLLPSANSASADESTETTYTLKFYDSDGTTVLKTFTGSGDKVFTEEEYNSIPAPTVPDGKVFTGYWSVGFYLPKSAIVGETYYYLDVEGFSKATPVVVPESITFNFYDSADNSKIGSLTKNYNATITENEISALLSKDWYTYEIKKSSSSNALDVDLDDGAVWRVYEKNSTEWYVYFDEIIAYVDFFSLDNSVLFTSVFGGGSTLLMDESSLNSITNQIPAIEGKLFTGYWTVNRNSTDFADAIDIRNMTIKKLWSVLGYSVSNTRSVNLYPFCYNAVASIQFNAAEDNSAVLGTLTKVGNEPITKADLDSVLAKRGYSYVYSLSGGDKDSVLNNPADIEGKTPFELKRETVDNYFVVYQINNYTTTIKFGNDVVKTYTNQYNSRISAGLLKTDLAKEGYKLLGLSDTADGTAITTIPEEGLHVVNDATYYVRYQKIQTLSIIDGDKTETAEVPADTPLFIKNYVSADKFKREGYIFKGFALTEGGEVAYDLDTTQITITADTTLYAVYVKALTVNFMADGKVAFYAMIEPGKTIDLSGSGIHSILEKPGYTLKGFATEENGEIVYAATDIIIPETDSTLYAMYEEVKTPGGDENPDKPGDIGDKVNDVSNKISEWIKGKTGIALSSSAVIVLAVVFAIVLFKRR